MNLSADSRFTSKKILMLSQTVFPPDIRLEKEIKSLNKAGYEVVVLCNQYQKDISPFFEHSKIVRVKALFNSIKLNKIFNFPLFVNPRYFIPAFSLLIKFKPDVIHAHDLPMVPLALILRLFRMRTKVIYDMHENYPEALKYFQKKGIQKLIKNYKLAAIIDRFCIRFSDRIIVVIGENKDRLMKQRIPEKKLYIVSNVADINYFDKIDKIDFAEEEYKGKFLLLYTGTVSPERGLETPVKAVNILKDKIKNIYLLIVGDGNSVDPLTQLVKSLSLEAYVELKAWVGHQNLKKYILQADVCIIPQPFNDYINTTIPHKLFEYMSFSKPVLVSDAKPLKRIVEESGAGLVFKSEDEKDFAEQVIRLNDNPDSYGDNGAKAVREKYNWENEEKNLFEVYKSIGL